MCRHTYTHTHTHTHYGTHSGAVVSICKAHTGTCRLLAGGSDCAFAGAGAGTGRAVADDGGAVCVGCVCVCVCLCVLVCVCACESHTIYAHTCSFARRTRGSGLAFGGGSGVHLFTDRAFFRTFGRRHHDHGRSCRSLHGSLRDNRGLGGVAGGGGGDGAMVRSLVVV